MTQWLTKFQTAFDGSARIIGKNVKNAVLKTRRSIGEDEALEHGNDPRLDH
jgi:hypothetical protein